MFKAEFIEAGAKVIHDAVMEGTGRLLDLPPGSNAAFEDTDLAHREVYREAFRRALEFVE